MRSRFNPVLAGALAVAVLSTPICAAQARGSHGAPAFGPGFGVRRGPSPFFDHRRTEFPGAYILGDPFAWYGDYQYSPPAPEHDPGPVYVLRSAVNTPSQPKLSPLLIELEGDRYVRHGGTLQSPPGQGSREPRVMAAPAQGSAPNVDTTPLAPTVLIFLDGHREEIPEYAIVGRLLYTHNQSDVQFGYARRTIELSALDIQATIKANRVNGIRFILPGPNEVVTRP